MKKLSLCLMGLFLVSSLYGQIMVSVSQSEYTRASELYQFAQEVNLMENQLRGGQAVHLDSIISPKTDDQYTVVKYTFDGTAYNKITYSTYDIGELVDLRGQNYQYDTRLQAIEYFNVDLASRTDIIYSVDELEYDNDGRLISMVRFNDQGNGLTPFYKYEFDYFNQILFRIKSFEVDEITSDFIPRRRYVYNRIPDGEFKGIQIDTFDSTNASYGQLGFAEYVRDDNRILEQFYNYDKTLSDYILQSSWDYILDPLSGMLKSRQYKASQGTGFNWKIEYGYDLADQVFIQLEKFEFPNSQGQDDTYSRLDYAYDYSVQRNDLALPPELLFDGFIGIGRTLDPDFYHHKIDFIRLRTFDDDYVVDSDRVTDYFWSDDALTSTLDLQENEILAFPNPVKDVLTVILSESEVHEVAIYNSYGDQVDHIRVNGTSEVVVSDWPPGVYILRAMNSTWETLQTSFIKQ